MSLRPNGTDGSSGFTLLELMIVVAILGVIAAIAVGILSEQTEKAMVSAVAADLKTFESGFLNFASDNGDFPSDSHLEGDSHLPAGEGVEAYLPVQRWASETPLGGNYNWEGPDFYPYAGVSVFKPSAPASTFALLDKTIDDGDLGAGKFRVATNGRYTYIIDE